MSCCSRCAGFDAQFDAERAAKELRRYRRRGPRGTARALLALLREAGAEGETQLDVGAGIGVLHHELLARGVRRAVHVEASAAFRAAALEEAGRRGQAGRLELLAGDFVELAPAIPAADLVTLDRVICCYAAAAELVAASAGKARRFWAASFPRDLWYVRWLFALDNRRRRRAGNPFRTFVHPESAIDRALVVAGLRRRRVRRGLFWEIVVCDRATAPAN
jgi:magnesium-protoporphyrin O-methyltransferase